ncbi:MAG: hypothetical protein ACRDNE_00630 [Gaiellaceae bacterium]
MATVVLTTEEITRAGIDATDTAMDAADTYKVNNDGRTYLHFKKSGAGACTVTITTPGTVDGQAIADRTVNVPATTGDVRTGPFPRDVYNDGSGQLTFAVSEATGLTCAVLRLP